MKLKLPVILGFKKHQIEEGQEDDNEDTTVNIHTLYKHRWVWYHLILCIQMILTNILLIGILIILALK
tara:strand:- start:2569 stop:2772 length:204 start_codon:yes stop_codon:yes gene_type:complete